MTFELKQYRIKVKLNSKRPWTHLKWHRNSWRTDEWSRHFVWGRLSVFIDTPDESKVQVCPHCHGPVSHLGEDGIDFCNEGGCGCIEGDKTTYMTVRELENRG